MLRVQETNSADSVETVLDRAAELAGGTRTVYFEPPVEEPKKGN
jgi:hypothetical protein